MMCVGSSDQRGIPTSISATARCPYWPINRASPACSSAGSCPVLKSAASSAGFRPVTAAREPPSFLITWARRHSSRSISVVTLLGRPRSTTCRSSHRPTAQQLPGQRQCRRSPAPGGAGWTAPPRTGWYPGRVQHGRAAAARVAPAGSRRESPNSRAFRFGPAEGRVRPEGRPEQCLRHPGMRRGRHHVAQQAQRRPPGHGKPRVLEDPPQHRGRARFHHVEDPGHDPPAGGAAGNSASGRSTSAGPPQRKAAGRCAAAGTSNCAARATDEAMQPERCQAHRSDGAGQALRQAEAEIHAGAVRPPAGCRLRVRWGTGNSVVMGRDCVSHRRPLPSMAHSMSCGAPKCCSTRWPSAASSAACWSVRHAVGAAVADRHGPGSAAGDRPDGDALVAEAPLQDTRP